jgi:hypothetical protein
MECAVYRLATGNILGAKICPYVSHETEFYFAEWKDKWDGTKRPISLSPPADVRRVSWPREKDVFISLPQSNLLLSSLSPAYRNSLLSRLKPVSLPVGTPIYRFEDTPRQAHFMTSGIASVVSAMENGASAEVGIWGHEGLAQSFHLLGKARVPNNCFVQVEATALVMPFSELQREFQTNEEMRTRVLQCVQSQGLSSANWRRAIGSMRPRSGWRAGC